MHFPSVHAALGAMAARFPDHPLFILPSRVQALWAAPRDTWTYADVARIVDAFAGRYRAAGVGSGDRIALLLANRPEHFFHWLALNALGASMVPLNPESGPDEFRYVLRHSEARFIVALPPLVARVALIARECAVPIVEASGDASLDDLPDLRAPRPDSIPSDANTECALLYTSGTTGRPKGCLLSNAHFLGWGEWYVAQRGLIDLRPGAERLIQPLPTFHVNATANSFIGMLASGGAQVIVDRFHPRSWWQESIETGATCFHYLGVMPAMLLNQPASDLDRAHRIRFAMGGGVHPLHHAAFESRFGVPLLEGWAMSETGGGGILCAMQEPRHVGRSCIGRPDRDGPPVEVRVADENGDPVPRGTPGELLVRARGAEPRLRFFSGYLKDPEATEHAWRGGWLHTGDLVREGEDGAIFFVDRLKNIIRRSGENIAAAEVESALLAHPAVGQCVVIAVPDDVRGEEVMAVVTPRPDAIADATLARALAEHCLERIAYFKAPGWVAFRDTLPTTSTQKIRVAALGDLAQTPASQPDVFDLRVLKRRSTLS